MTTTETSPQADVQVDSSDEARDIELVGHLIPIFIIADRSGSMNGEPIAAVNRELQALATGLVNHPLAGALTRLEVISFADDARVDLEMEEVVNAHGHMPHLFAGGRTSLAAALDLAASEIAPRCEALRHPNRETTVSVNRPTAFVFTDGQPTDPESQWRNALGRMTDLSNKWRANIVAFGIGAADPTVIAALPQGHGAAFMANRGEDTTTSIDAILRAILGSVVQTAVGAQAAATMGGQTPVPPPIPTAVPGMTPLPMTVTP